MEQPDNVTLNGVTLVLTCGACPEQYDAFMEGRQVGYLRLRHGYFYASCPDVPGEVVFEANPVGDGIFEDEERFEYLDKATAAIAQWAREHGEAW